MAQSSKAKQNFGPVDIGREAYEITSADSLKSSVSVSENHHFHTKLLEISQLLWLPESKSEEERLRILVQAVELFESLAPRDGAEGMLALQMVGTHHAALECLRRAMIPEQLLPASEHNLRMAEKMMSLYAKQLETLNRHRGKGQQKMTVEYFNVEAGGQAIVGSIETDRAATTKPQKLKPKSKLSRKAMAGLAENAPNAVKLSSTRTHEQ